MKKNLGYLDRAIRLVIAAAVGVLYWQGLISGTLAIVLGAVAVIFAATSFVSFCPIYAVLGWRSVRQKVLGKS